MLVSDVIVGLQHGDEGKGKVCYNLMKNNSYDYCIRFNGGPNAGHTIHTDNLCKVPNKKIVLHQIPCGILLEKSCIIGTGCVIDLKKLELEIKYLEDIGFTNTRELLYIAHNAHIITDEHIVIDNKSNTIGTTKCGIGPCYTDKHKRHGTQALHEKDTINNMMLKLINIPEYFRQFSQSNLTLLFEGAQGFLLDVDWGDYPFVTSSSCISSSIGTCGIPASTIRHVYGCCKIYDTYVGSKNFQPDNATNLISLGTIGEEIGATTGRGRQCNWLNLNDLNRAIFVNGCTHIILNKCDILQQLDSYKLYNSTITNTIFDTNILNTIEFTNFEQMKEYIQSIIYTNNSYDIDIIFSSSPYKI